MQFIAGLLPDHGTLLFVTTVSLAEAYNNVEPEKLTVMIWLLDILVTLIGCTLKAFEYTKVIKLQLIYLLLYQIG